MLCLNLFSLGLLVLWATIFLAESTTLIIDDESDDEPPDVHYCAVDRAANKCNLRSAWLLCQSEVAASAAAVVCRFDVMPTLRTLFIDTISRAELILTSGMHVEIYGSAAIVQPYITLSGRRFVSSSGNENKFTSLAIYNTTFFGFNNSALYLKNTGYFTFRDVSFWGNRGTDGGALNLVNTSGLFDECDFSGNIAIRFGGALTMTSGQNVTIHNSNFTQNTAISGGAIYNEDDVNGLTIQRSYFGQNTAGSTNGYGGAIYLAALKGSINVFIGDCIFNLNVGFVGGSIYLGNAIDGLTIRRSDFEKNTANYVGGAIYVSASTYLKNTLIEDCNCSRNVGYYGGAIYLGKVVDSLTIRRSNFDSNSAASNGYGAAIFVSASTYLKNFLIEDCIFSLNVGYSGGAIFLGSAIDGLTIRRSDFEKNTANYVGGAICVSASTYLKNTLIEDCLFDQNTAGISSGAIAVYDYIDGFRIVHSNFTNNVCKGERLVGAVGLAGTKYLSNVYIENCNFRGNTGEGLRLHLAGENISITNCDFIENSNGIFTDRNFHPGGISIGNGFKNVKLKNINFVGNSGKSGTFYIGSNNVFISVQNTAFIRNYATTGVGIFLASNNSNISLKNVTFIENIATGKGGGLYVDQLNSNIDILNCIFDGNTAAYGGGIFIHRSNRYIAIASTDFVNNSASINGGGIAANEDNMNILISDNETYASSVVAETMHPYTYGTETMPVGYSATFTVPGATSYWVVFDYKTNTWMNDFVCIYDSSVSRHLFWKNSGTINWPGVDSPVLQVDSPSLYIELKYFPPGYVQPKVPAYGFKATIYPVFETTSKTPTRFENNYASNGGAAHFNYLQEFILMSQCIVRYNYAETEGGGLYFENTNSGIRLQRLMMKENSAGGAGGALYFSTANYGVVLQDIIFEDNQAEEKNGGAIFLASGNGKGLYVVDNNVNIQNCAFKNNSAYSGGGIAVFYKNNFTLSHCIFEMNYASQLGAGVYLDEANIVSFDNVDLTGNKAFSGGGLYSALSNTVIMTSVNFYSNEAYLFGGALVSINRTVLNVGSVVLDGNKAYVGGGIFLRGTYLWDLQAGFRIDFIENSALFGSAFSIADLKSSPVVPNLKLHDIIFQNNTAMNGGTVFWIKEPGENNEPPGLNDTTLVWSGNYAAYGVKAATQCIFVDLPPKHNVNVYNTPIRPIISAELKDYYGQLIITNSTGVETSIVDFQCFDATAYTDGGTKTVSVMGHADFALLQVHCYPLGNVTMAFTAVVQEIDLLGLSRSNSYNPVSISTLEYRDCIAGEYLADRSCIVCDTGSYLLVYKVDTLCFECPPEAYMCFGNQIFVRSGYWRRFPGSHALLECPGTGAGCVGGNSTGDGLCGLGYEGVLCAVCSSGYYKNSATSLCAQCSGSNIFTPTVVVVLVIFICALFLLSIAVYGQIKRYLSESPDGIGEHSEKDKLIKEKLTYWQERFALLRDRFKILMSTFQIACSIQASTHVKFPSSFTNFLAIFKILNFNLLDIMPISCVYQNDYVSDLILATLLPVAASMMIFMVFVFELILYRSKYLITEETDMALFRRLKRRYFSMFLMLTYLILPSTTTSIFRMFLCEDVDPYNEDKADDLFLTSDYSLSCTSERYKFGVIVAVVMIFVYPIGIISCYAVFLYKRRKEIIDPDLMKDDEDRKAKVAMVEFLYRSYRPSCWYFELIETCRRLMLTAVLATIAPGSSAQAVFALLISLFCIKTYSVANPYQNPQGAIIADIGQFQVFFTFMGALILKNDLLGKSWDNAVGAILVVISLTVVLAIFYFEAVAFHTKRLKRLEKLRLLEDKEKKRHVALGATIEMVEIISLKGHIPSVLNQKETLSEQKSINKLVGVVDKSQKERGYYDGSDIESSGGATSTTSPLHNTISDERVEHRSKKLERDTT